jgi:hypothetical protein
MHTKHVCTALDKETDHMTSADVGTAEQFVSREVYGSMRKMARLPPEANVDHLVAKCQSGNRRERRAAWAQLRRAQKKAGKR